MLGCPHPKWGQVGLAVCVKAEGRDVDPQELSDHLRPKLARYKHPAAYVFVAEMPKSSYGKITKRQVEAMLKERGVWPDFGQSLVQ
ncbi:AMP-binding enzyme [Thalassococcus profundi]|uniref:AMP-binding enzyme n=1 Tax=Thalassococcus profundi TaxID=2282382 RepID=UPI00389AF490